MKGRSVVNNDALDAYLLDSKHLTNVNNNGKKNTKEVNEILNNSYEKINFFFKLFS